MCFSRAATEHVLVKSHYTWMQQSAIYNTLPKRVELKLCKYKQQNSSFVTKIKAADGGF
jgi:hypothetical protein